MAAVDRRSCENNAAKGFVMIGSINYQCVVGRNAMVNLSCLGILESIHYWRTLYFTENL